jgi:hypothetical protein
MSGDTTRSRRLGALLYLYAGGPPDPLALRDELHRDELDALADLTEDDRHLANACLALEAHLRRRQFAAVERLLAVGVFSPLDAPAHLAALPPAAKGRAAEDLLFLGLVPGL